jgi:hypothetical protein
MRCVLLPSLLFAALISTSASAQPTRGAASVRPVLANPAGPQQVAARHRKPATRHARVRRGAGRSHRAPALYPGGQAISPSAPPAATRGGSPGIYESTTGGGGGY